MKTLSPLCLGVLLLLACWNAPAAPPVATTLQPANVAKTKATLKARVNPKHHVTEVFFIWGLTESYGNITATQRLGNGVLGVPLHRNLTNLVPGATYHYRVVALSSQGGVYGEDVSFTTRAVVPVATTESATDVTREQATLRGTVQPGGPAMSAYFQWGLSTAYGNTTPVQLTGAGANAASLQQIVGGLTAGATYHFRMVGSNVLGVRYGSDGVFTTDNTLQAQTETAVNVTLVQATLRGRVHPAGSEAVAFFEWGTSTNYEHSTPPQAVGNGMVLVPVEQLISGLTPAALYHFRMVGSNALGVRYGADGVFTTDNSPQARTETAVNVTPVQATLRGRVHPASSEAVAFFEWGTSTNYEHSTSPQAVGNGMLLVPVEQLITELTPAALFHFRMVGSNALGFHYGSDVTFAAVAAPLAVTQPATALPGMAISLNGTVNPNALETSVSFEWGLTTNYGNVTASTVLPAGTVEVAVEMLLTNLPSGGIYHARVRATNSAGTSVGADASVLIICEVNNNLVAIVPECSEASLRSAIAAAGRVVFACDGTIALTSPIDVSCNLVLDGSGQNVALSGGGITRLFNVLPGASLTLLNLTLTNGLVRGTNGFNALSSSSGIAQAGESAEGGGVLVSSAALIARDCTFSFCAAIGGDGGNAGGFPPSGGPSGSGTGGAISARSSSVTLSNCLFSGSTASAGLPGISYAFGNGSLQRASSGVSSGGAIFALEGTTVITNCEFRSNTAATGGAVEITGQVSVTHIERTEFIGNSAGGYGGALDVNGSSSVTTVNHSEFFGNAAGNSGGALVIQSGSLAVGQSTFRRNEAIGASTVGIHGGAMAILSGQVVLADCDFATNFCRGASANPGDGTAGYGGALAVFGGAVQVSRSTFRANGVFGGNAVFRYPFGGGTPAHAFGGAIYSTAALSLTNCTLALNYAYPGYATAALGMYHSAAAVGGAIAGQGGSIVLAFSTLASNRVSDIVGTQSQGGALYGNGTPVKMINCILSGNSVNTNASANYFGTTLVDDGHNLSSDATPAWTLGTSLSNTDALLRPLADYGGLTFTMALWLGSPALDTADCLNAPATDQRGATRPHGPGCDIGAYEGPGVPQP